jgi:hypothetical protein
LESIDILLDSERRLEGFDKTGKMQLWNHIELVTFF